MARFLLRYQARTASGIVQIHEAIAASGLPIELADDTHPGLIADDVDWTIFVDADVALTRNAFAGLRRWQRRSDVGVIGGIARRYDMQRFGVMLAPRRWGAGAVEWVVQEGPASERIPANLELFVDLPARGVLVVSRALRAAVDTVSEPFGHIDVGLAARTLGLRVASEPTMQFSVAADSIAYRRLLPRRVRSISIPPESRYRLPSALREGSIAREMRIAGNVRGYEQRAMPPARAIVTTRAEARTLQAQRIFSEVLAEPTDAGRAYAERLAESADRYLAIVRRADGVDRAGWFAAIQQIESAGSIAIYDDPAGAFSIVHQGRFPAVDVPGNSVDDVLAAARSTAVAHGLIVLGQTREATIPRAAPTFDVVLVAASRPELALQASTALAQIDGATSRTAIVAEAALTSRTALESIGIFSVVCDDDAFLVTSINRVLGSLGAAYVLIVRDDFLLGPQSIALLGQAFTRIPGLAIAVPRVGGTAFLEMLPEITYQDPQQMLAYMERRANDYAREASLVDTATAPVLAISREALATVGGFDRTLGFTRAGVADFSRRVHAANFRIARCEDVFVHAFAPAASESLLAALDSSRALEDVAEKKRAQVGFVKARDRVAFDAPPPRVAGGPLRTVLVAIGSRAEWAALQTAVIAIVTELRAGDGIALALAIDGEVEIGPIALALRDALADSAIPSEQSIDVDVAGVRDLLAWRAQFSQPLVLRGVDRDALRDLPEYEPLDGVRNPVRR